MESLPINVADIAVIAVIVISGILALFRGLVHEVLAVGSWIGASFATLYGFGYALPYVKQVITVDLFAEVTTAVVLFVAVLVVLTIFTRMLCQHVRNSGLGPLDRTLGMLFGFLRGGVIVCLAWIAYTWAIPQQDHPVWIEEARTKPLIEEGALMLNALIPEQYRSRAEDTARDAVEKAQDIQGANQAFQDIVSPRPKADAREGEPEYNRLMREQMRRAIEAAGDKEPVREQAQ
ncbi:CvpA family protein [Pelagibius sp. Alg239-R121]|uniref:CvpA family protein n=1 Tax=Pelagibius sp. Alg239-R121 TaxID=2993448 RepID=UPI0024A72808|nr:CvpA family protein [Pelagibius sp. Alg239-R121]